MNDRHIKKVHTICDALTHDCNNIELVKSKLIGTVSYKCLECGLFILNDGKCYGKTSILPCLIIEEMKEG